MSLVQYLEDCWRDNDEGDFPKMCILCVCIIINKRVLNLFVFGSCFRTLAVILCQNFFHNNKADIKTDDISIQKFLIQS